MGKWFQDKSFSTEKWEQGIKARKVHRAFGVLLAAAVVLQTMPFGGTAVSASESNGGGLCEHHTEHTADCGYREAEPGHECTHEHTEDCYQTVEKEDGSTTEELDCHHEHDESCGYREAAEESPCTFVCEKCNDETDGTSEDNTDGNEINDGDSEKAGTENGNEIEEPGDGQEENTDQQEDTGLCKHHREHDDTCGYLPESEDGEGSPCTYACRICPIEELIAALPDIADITEDNADGVRAQLEEFLALYRELTGEEQEQIDLSRVYALQEALDKSNGSDPAEEHNWRYSGTGLATNVMTIYRTCEDCQRRENVGTITMRDFSVPYGQTNGVELAYTTNLTGDHHLVDNEGYRVWYLYGDYPPGGGENTLHYTLGNLPVGKYMYNFAPRLFDGTKEVPYFIGLNITVTVTRAALPEAALSTESVTYNGSVQKPTVTIEGLTEGTDYDIAYSTEDFINAGTVIITVTGKENYEGTIKKTFTVEKATPTIVWDTEEMTVTYTGQPANIRPTVILVNHEPYSGTINYKYGNYSGSVLPADVGTYRIKAGIAEQGNYNAAESDWMTLYIDKASAPTITYPTAGSITYGQRLSDSALTGGSTKYGTFAWKDGNTVPAVDDTTGYAVVFTASEETEKNYETITDTTQNVPVKVEKAVPAVSIKAAVSGSEDSRQAVLTVNVTKAGAGAFPTGTVRLMECTGGTETERGTVTLNSSGLASYTWKGLLDKEYTIKAVYEGDNNYADAESRKLAFDAGKENQQGFRLDPIGAKTYGSADVTLSTTGGSGTGAVRYKSSDEDVIRIENGRAVIVGAGAVTITAIKEEDDTYNEASASEYVIVAKKALTVTARDKTVVRGQAMPAFTYIAAGLVNGDTFTKDPSMTTSVQNTDTLGRYDIVINGGTLRNSGSYQITYANGILNITECFYNVTVVNGTGGGEYAEGDTVTVTANDRSGYTFTGWSSADGVTFANNSARTTTFTMPAKAVTVKADYSRNSSGNNGGGSGGNGNSGGFAGNSGGGNAGGNEENGGQDSEGNNTNPGNGNLSRPVPQPAGVGTNPGNETAPGTNLDSGTKTSVQGTKQPFIKGEDGKIGWDVIRAEEEKTQEGGTINVDMNGSTMVPGDIFDSMKGKDITITFDMGNGILWSVDGKSITTDKADDIDLSVKTGVSNVPVDIVNNVIGESYNIQISLSYEGEFGFTAVLSIGLGKENAGYTASLYYYNGSTGELEFICKDQIAEDGTASLAFTHASDYVIVIDEEQEEQSGGGAAIQPEDTSQTIGDKTVQDSDGIPGGPDNGQTGGGWWILVVLLLVIAIGAGVFVAVKKKGER